MTYVERPTTGSHHGKDIFVELPAENDDAKNFIVHRGDSAFIMLNAFPYATAHLLVAPYRQVSDITEMNEQELLEVNRLLAKGVGWIRSAYNPDGFNIGVNMGRSAGAGIPQHIHWHVVPRWSGDTNFMTTIGNVKIMPESLDATFLRLREVIALDL